MYIRNEETPWRGEYKTKTSLEKQNVMRWPRSLQELTIIG